MADRIETFFYITWTVVVAGVVLVVLPRAFDPFGPVKDALLVAGAGLLAAGVGARALLEKPRFSPGLPIIAAWVVVIFAWLLPFLPDTAAPASPALHSVETLRLTALVLTASAVAFLAMEGGGGRVRLLRVWLVVGLCEAVVVLLQFIGLDPFYLVTGTHGTWRVYGTIGNPNLAAILIVPIGLLSLDEKLVPSGRLCLALVVVTGLAVAACGGRVAAVIFAAGLVLISARGKGPGRRLPIVPVIVASLIVVVSAFLVSHLMGKGFGSPGGRLFFWQAALALFKEAPLAGYGLGHFAAAYPDGAALLTGAPMALPVHAHNDWLEFSVELGLIATLLPICAVWVVWSGWKRPDTRITAVALASLLLAACWYSLLHHTPTALLSWTLLGILSAKKGRAAFERGPINVMSAAAVLVIGLALLFNTPTMVDRLRAHWTAGDGLQAVADEERDAATALWRKAWELAPSEGAFAYRLSQGLAMQGHFLEALTISEKAAESYADFNLYILQARLYAQTGRPDKAIEILNRLQNVFPELKKSRQLFDVIERYRADTE